MDADLEVVDPSEVDSEITDAQDELADESDQDSSAEADSSKEKKIPTWEEAMSYLLKPPKRGSGTATKAASSSGGGRSSGGRRRRRR